MKELSESVDSLYKKLRGLEVIHQDAEEFEISSDLISELRLHFTKIADSSPGLSAENKLELQKISELQKHLASPLKMRTLQSLLIPFERYLKKQLAETDFLVTTHDRQRHQIQKKFPLILILENIRSSFNVGSVFRLADNFGISEVYLVGYTARPDQYDFSKTALGSEKSVSWQHFSDMAGAIQQARSQGMRVIALETSSQGMQIFEKFQEVPTAFVLGNERFGLGPEVLSMVDEIRQIPTYGLKNSLNMGHSASVACYEWIRQRNFN